MNLYIRVGEIKPRIGPSPWSDHDYVCDYSVMVLPFFSNDLLALRV